MKSIQLEFWREIFFDEDLKSKIRERILKQILVNPLTQCWDWQGNIVQSGYGVMRVKVKRRLVTRLVAVAFNNKLLGPKDLVCHSCDNRRCCNPEHLWIGDNSANLLDAVAKGRKGNKNTHCIRGHDLSITAGYYLLGGKTLRRRCKVCTNQGKRERRLRNKASAG